MRTSTSTADEAEPRLLGPRITRGLLDRLAARAVTAGPTGAGSGRDASDR